MVGGYCMKTFLTYNLIPISLFLVAVGAEYHSPIHIRKITCAPKKKPAWLRYREAPKELTVKITAFRGRNF